MRHRIQYLFLSLVIIIASCGGDSDEEQLTLPSGLTFDVTVNNAGTGDVSVTATAQKANFYTIFFGDVTGEIGVKSNDGKGNHKYIASGTYTVKVQAHTTATAFVTESKQVTVQVKSADDLIIPTTGYKTPSEYSGMSLIWKDEFDGTALNTSDWTHETGNGTNGWGNNELQYYKPENTAVKDGYLIITAKKEAVGGSLYTSSRIITKGKKSFKYGRIDIRAALPKGQGIWPALWMLGSNISEVSWPKCGEIDIMEMVGGTGKDNTVHGTVHWDENGQRALYGKSKTLASGIFNDEFHVFSIVWTDSSITWYVDDVQFNVIDTKPAGLNEFKEEFFFIFNVAVGGDWPGSPDGTTVFPQRMVVDYVRVFQ